MLRLSRHVGQLWDDRLAVCRAAWRARVSLRCADARCGAQADEASGRLREVLTPYIEAVAATLAPLKGQLQFAALREATESSEFGELARRLRRSLGGPERA
jgi:hypothetical protein